MNTTQLDGGLEEFVDEFKNSQIQYGFARVTDDNHGATKYIFVAWVRIMSAIHQSITPHCGQTGDGAPVERKGLCANHQRDVAKYFSVRT